jgi:hypothetical protein
MIKITKDTFQKLLLTELSGQSKKPGDLYIFVESLPLFLSTSIAFKIFNYQLRNFPRKVIWTAVDDKIVHMMGLVDLPVKPHLSKDQIIELEHESATPKQLTDSTSSISGSINITPKIIKTDVVADTKKLKEHSKISLKQLFDSGDYNRSSLLNSEEGDVPNKGKTLQDLDSWIDRIEATKKALNSMKGEDVDEETQDDLLDTGNANIAVVSSKFSSFIPFSRSKKQPKAFLFITSFFSCALVFIIGMVFFPTNVYTLDVNSPEDSGVINLSIPSTAFTKQSIKLSANVNIPTSGDNQTGTERASGKIDLINKSSKPVSLSNGSFSLVKDGKVYTHLRNSTLPDEIILAPFNDLSPVTISVQATELGSDSNQPVNSIFEILNILEQKPCSSCFGISTSEIVAGDGTGKKIVTEADQSLLRATVDGILAQQKVSKIQSLKDEKNGIDDIVVNNDWYSNTNSSYVFKPDLGQSAPTTNLEATVDTNIYYIPKSTLDEILQRENQAVDRVTEVNVAESIGQFKEQPTDIKIKVNYKFNKKVNINQKDIEKTITSTSDFVSAKEKIQKDYQSIVNIEKKELGLKIPFLPPATNIKYIQNN